jgi:hypothetical protein
MKRIINLTEADLARIVKRVLKEEESPTSPEMPETPPAEYLDLIASADIKKDSDDDDMTQQVAEDWYKRRMNRRK